MKRTQRRPPLTNVLERFAAFSSDFMKAGRGVHTERNRTVPRRVKKTGEVRRRQRRG